MSSDVQGITFEPGYIVLTDGHGRRTRYPASSFLSAAMIPDLNIDSLSLLKSLAGVVQVLVQTQMDAGTLSQNELYGGYDIDWLMEVLQSDMETDIGDNEASNTIPDASNP